MWASRVGWRCELRGARISTTRGTRPGEAGHDNGVESIRPSYVPGVKESSVCLRNRPESSQGWSSLALPDRAPGTVPFQRERLRYPGTQRGLSAATKLEDWIDYAIRSDCAPFSLAEFDNLAQKTRLSRLVVQGRTDKMGPSGRGTPSFRTFLGEPNPH